jgi:hypothetical protein
VGHAGAAISRGQLLAGWRHPGGDRNTRLAARRASVRSLSYPPVPASCLCGSAQHVGSPHSRCRDLGRCRDRFDIRPASAPCRSSPNRRRAMNPCSMWVAAANRPPRAARRRPWVRAPAMDAITASLRSVSAMLSAGVAAGGCSDGSSPLSLTNSNTWLMCRHVTALIISMAYEAVGEDQSDAACTSAGPTSRRPRGVLPVR